MCHFRPKTWQINSNLVVGNLEDHCKGITAFDLLLETHLARIVDSQPQRRLNGEYFFLHKIMYILRSKYSGSLALGYGKYFEFLNRLFVRICRGLE